MTDIHSLIGDDELDLMDTPTVREAIALESIQEEGEECHA